mgnify:CR=1 FL=1
MFWKMNVSIGHIWTDVVLNEYVLISHASGIGICKMSHFKCHFVSIKPNDNTLGKCKNDKHEFNGQKQMGLTSFGVYHDMLLLQ